MGKFGSISISFILIFVFFRVGEAFTVINKTLVIDLSCQSFLSGNQEIEDFFFCFDLNLSWTKFQSMKHLLTHVFTDKLSSGHVGFDELTKMFILKSQNICTKSDIAIKASEIAKQEKSI